MSLGPGEGAEGTVRLDLHVNISILIAHPHQGVGIMSGQELKVNKGIRKGVASMSCDFYIEYYTYIVAAEERDTLNVPGFCFTPTKPSHLCMLDRLLCLHPIKVPQ